KDLQSEGGVPPAQLQIVCSKLYDQFARQLTITVEHYRTLGGARQILGTYLNEVLGTLAPSTRELALLVLRELVSSKKTKNLLTLPEMARRLRMDTDPIESAVSELQRYRLIRRVETGETHSYELVHEYILEQVWLGLSEDEAKIKEAQEIIETDTRYWP